jgi:glucose/mannose-6-phosphate isomerase
LLDELEEIRNIDQDNIIEIFLNFPENIEQALDLARGTALDDSIQSSSISNIVITGIGGSAIGGDILNAWLMDQLDVPIMVNRDYTIPGFANANTLLIGVSYSGNTQETLTAVEEAHKRNCKIVCVTSGGQLEEFCIKNQISVIKIPSGMPPRSATAFLLFPLAVILEKLKLVDPQSEITSTLGTLRKLRDELKPEVPLDTNPGKQIALKIKDSFPLTFGYGFLLPIARRLKTQFNENSKILAGFGSFPESSHNDIIGWAEDEEYVKQQFSVIYLRSDNEPEKVTRQIEYTKGLQEGHVNVVLELKAPKGTRLEQMLYLLYLGDFISIYLAILRGIDPTPITAIDQMKKALK